MYRSSHFASQNGERGLSEPQSPFSQQQSPFSQQKSETHAFQQNSFTAGPPPAPPAGAPSFEAPKGRAPENNLTVFRDTTLSYMPPPASYSPPHLPTGEEEEDYADEQISALFTAMGRASQLTRDVIAIRLQTSSEIIAALEAGHLAKLPEWDELSELVERYAAFMNIDERPILRRLREQLTEHYLSRMTQQKSQIEAGDVSPMPLSDSGLADFASGAASFAAMDHHHGQSDIGNADLEHKDFAKPTMNSLSAESLKAKDPAFRDLSKGRSFVNDLATGAASEHETRANVTPLFERGPQTQFPGDAVKLDGVEQNRKVENRGKFTAVTGAEHRLKPKAQQLKAAARVDNLPPHHLQQQRGEQQRHPAPLGQQGVIASQHYEQPRVELKPAGITERRGLPLFVKIAANAAFIVILLFAFIQWQPNRFWSGVDQLPKPIANTIYDLFEMVMPDPLATSYRMNWVLVDDPRMRKADRLPVPQIKRLPAIDFSNLTLK